MAPLCACAGLIPSKSSRSSECYFFSSCKGVFRKDAEPEEHPQLQLPKKLCKRDEKPLKSELAIFSAEKLDPRCSSRILVAKRLFKALQCVGEIFTFFTKKRLNKQQL